MSERSSSALVSVVIPVHDAAEYISDTLSSILSQSLQDIEVIIIDDNSADDTLKRKPNENLHPEIEPSKKPYSLFQC